MNRAKSVYSDSPVWNVAVNMIWFGQNWKWFILLLAILPGQFDDAAGPGQKNTVWGMVFALGAIWACIGPALFGRWSDRVGRRKIFLGIGTALTVAALALLAGGDSIPVLVLGYIFLQISDDVQQGAYSSLIPQIVPEERQGRVSAVMGGLSLLANICAAISGLVVGANGMFGLTTVQAIYLFIAIVQVLSAIPVLWAIRHLEEPFERTVSTLPSWRSWLEPWRHKDFVRVWLIRFMVAMGYYLIQPFLKFYLEAGFATKSVNEDGETVYSFLFFGQQLVGGDMGVYIVGLTISLTGALAAIIAAKKLEKLGNKKMVIIAGVVMFCIMIPFAAVRDFTVAWCLAAVFGVGYGLYMASSWAMASAVMPDRDRLGQDMGLWQSGNTAAQVSPALVGPLIDVMNRGNGVLGYSVAILLAGCFILIGCLVSSRVEGSN